MSPMTLEHIESINGGDTQLEGPAVLYDLLETQVDLWYDADRSMIDDNGDERVWHILWNVPLSMYKLIPKGTRALFLGCAVDMVMPDFDEDTGAVSSRRIKMPYLLLDGMPFTYMPIGKELEYEFDQAFKVVSRVDHQSTETDGVFADVGGRT